MTEDHKSRLNLFSTLYALGIIISGLIAFYIRIIPKDQVLLNGFVRFSENDPWYHWRNIDLFIQNFPHMLWFDPYTLYPFGVKQIYAPFLDFFEGLIIWIIGAGNPSTELAQTIAAYFPAITAAFVVIPVYFVTKWIFNDRRMGLLAAILIATAPGQILSRSIIGFNDHHIAEVLLSTATAAFLVMGLKILREHPITFNSLKLSPAQSIKQIGPYFVLAGLSLGAYTLTWKGALFFSLIIGLYILVQHIVDHMHDRTTDYLSIGGVIIFGVTLLMILPVPEIGNTKSTHIMALTAGIIAFILLTLLSTKMREMKVEKKWYPISIFVALVILIIISKFVAPSMYAMFMSVFGYFAQTGGGLTVGEAQPFNLFDIPALFYYFGFMGFISFIGFAILIYEAFKRTNQEKVFLIVWTFMVLWAMLQQNRFSYYYAVNAAIITAYVSIRFLDMLGFNSDEKISERAVIKNQGKINAKTKKTTVKNISTTENAKKIKPIHIIGIIILLVVLVWPNYNLATSQAQYAGGPNDYWLDAVNWLRTNTPEPGIDYYKLYDAPKAGEVFPYPETAYGVMSWWDYGHWIQVIGQRIPNSNPFQQGIGGRRVSMDEPNIPGASPFFTAPDEDNATQVLKAIHPDPNKMGARYIVSDVEMATSKFYAMAAWTLDTNNYYISVPTSQGNQMAPSMRYFNSMEARLHIFDGNGLKQYRMVHETPAVNTQELVYKQIYNLMYNGSINEENTGYVKVFEYVKGANITGTAPAGQNVTISNIIYTSQGRSFRYSQSVTSNGTYTFTVPYSTQGPIDGQTEFDVSPNTSYTISDGVQYLQVPVNEIDVIQGNKIQV